MRLAQVSIKIFVLTALIVAISINSAPAQSSLSTCGIRVEFVEDNNDLTTGNGKFMMDTTDVNEFTVDPPPHNRPYFRDQIVAVSNYYYQASSGQLDITGDVFPVARDDAYQLDHTMGFYNPNTNEEENNRQLAQLFIDAVQKADSADEFIFSDFDVVTVFHAGVGKDIALGFDETPQDIPSIYFTPEFFRRYYDPNFTGIPVDGGTHIIDRGLLLPETQSQAEIEIGLLGIFAANMGSHLGLYDLFSPTEQESGIGVFGVMDAGLFNALGLAPAIPCAFSRNILGWENPTELNSPSQKIEVHPFRGENSTGQTLYKIPINQTEFYLVENRGDYTVNLDSLYFELAENRETPPTYLEVLKTYLPDRITVSDSTGVLLNIENYDWGLPGSGLLIWHIDETVILENGSENQINNDKNNRAVDLEEADGSQDIGFEYTIVEPGYQSELGTWLDYWFKENPTPLFQNEFSPTSAPNTRANRTLANSNIIMTDFSSRNSDIISFSLDLDYNKSGFPIVLSDSANNESFGNIFVEKTEFNDLSCMFTASSRGIIYAVTKSGEGIFDPGLYEVARYPEKEQLHIALNDTNSNQLYDQLIAASTSGMITGYRIDDRDNDNLLDTMFVVSIDDMISAPPVIAHPYFYIGTESGTVYRMTYTGIIDSVLNYQDAVTAITVIPDGEILTTLKGDDTPDYAPVVIDINGDGKWETITYPSYDRIRIENNDILLDDKMVAAPSFGDIDADGFYEIIVSTKYYVFAYNFNGVQETNFPLSPDLQPDEIIVGSILALDVSGDQKTDILFNTSKGQIFAYSGDGNLVPDFPFSAGGEVNLTPVAFDIDNDDQLEFFLLNTNSTLFGWQLQAGFSENELWWFQSAYNPTGNHYISRQLTPAGLPVTDLMPGKKAYVYPNPNIEAYTNIRYYLRESADVNIKIFDLAGDLVASLSGPGQGMVDNEVRWDLNGVSSGVYLCRIEAVAAGDKSVQIIKVMVIN